MLFSFYGLGVPASAGLGEHLKLHQVLPATFFRLLDLSLFLPKPDGDRQCCLPVHRRSVAKNRSLAAAMLERSSSVSSCVILPVPLLPSRTSFTPVQFCGMHQAHVGVTDPRTIQGAMEQSVLLVQDRLHQDPLASVVGE
ncbi:MAG: hypothetical protein NFW15_15285 [Candidatus Accumulibacter sp.]|nr:hypothetical protein [Accumulibacter sp.]MCM8613547.1 hypothetical protein [Accumulibacter sp.]MCM8637270.1 hypothetical protein [Accumulibacter sp.]MCM8638712.1 hypothetical protein [Accumulibacter sp.]